MKKSKQINKENLTNSKNSFQNKINTRKSSTNIYQKNSLNKKLSFQQKKLSFNRKNSYKVQQSCINKYNDLEKYNSFNNSNIKSTLQQICKGVYIKSSKRFPQSLNQSKDFKNSVKEKKKSLFYNKKQKSTQDKNLVSKKKRSTKRQNSFENAQYYQELINKKYSSIENLLNKIKNIQQPQKKNCGTQTNKEKFRVINFQNLTLLSILKEAASDVLFLDKNNIYQSLIDNAKDELKKHLIQETVLMIQEQMLFEEILKIFKDQNLDLEPIIVKAYNNLGVDIEKFNEKQKAKKVKNYQTQTSLDSSVKEYIKKENEQKNEVQKNKHNFCLDLKDISQFDSEICSEYQSQSEQLTQDSFQLTLKNYKIFHNAENKRQQIS